ncbi:ribonuclease HI family protein [Candidatus Uhrbacteria bacterium]|nr:ribonuclease HI family protein [Candidatus Uhrbacteria bacterium]
MSKLIIHTDGGARGNPGPSGIGVYVTDDRGNVLLEYGEYLGRKTNNQAEYQAVVVALDKARELGGTELDFYLDSELVVRQLRREYRVKDPGLAQLFVQVWNRLPNFKKVSFTHVRREYNKEADRLVNMAIDRG